MSDAEDPKRDARRIILARRRRFVAIALTGAGVATSSCDRDPTVCLSIAPPKDTSAPTACLSAPIDPEPDGPEAPDAGADAGDAGDSTGAGGAKANHDGDSDAGTDGGKSEPRVCLTVAPPKDEPAPRPCLTPLRPEFELDTKG